jgi:nickel-type superoxide dismutase maturation protease
VLVEGPSMVPTLRHGDQVVVWWARHPRPGEGAVVLVDLPDARGLGIKRISAVEASGRLWLEGDNPAGSTDSRHFGTVPASALLGRVLLRLWPHPGRVRRSNGPSPPSH